MHLQATSCSSLAHTEVRYTFNKGNIDITVLFLFFKLSVSQPCGAHFVQGEKICGETFYLCVHIFEVLTRDS